MIQSLKTRWLNFASKNAIPQPGYIWKSLNNLYNEDNREYHNLAHVQDCLNKLDYWPTTVPNREAIELAIWFHDVIYDPKRADNEEASAALMSHLILDHALEADATEEIMCDIDLSILGSSQSHKYMNYAHKIRQEYAWVDEEVYCKKRAQVLENFLNRGELYQTPYGKRRWGPLAIKNIQKERKMLLSGQAP